MLAIKKFFEAHKITAHTIAGSWIFIVSFYYSNTAARSYIDYEAHQVYTHFPKWLQGAVVSVLVPLFLYWKSTKRAGTA